MKNPPKITQYMVVNINKIVVVKQGVFDIQSGACTIHKKVLSFYMTKEEKNLVTTYVDSVFKGSLIRQECPTCECGKIFSVKELPDAPGVFFREVDVFGKKYTLIEPMCPICKRKIEAHYHILN
ncbi:MAG: hypothetical protein C0392_08865 [Syntrophus sp. (in: bacteria)]|nr:hypothetical protein [Syntrophus sp. (in: bacteria)]